MGLKGGGESASCCPAMKQNNILLFQQRSVLYLVSLFGIDT